MEFQRVRSKKELGTTMLQFLQEHNTIGTKTVDERGNINTTMNTHTATTILLGKVH